ncbi:TMEM165/GDT1 family protein [Faecalispora anaeroviscerum]|uniref:TMEM165/GDT1 family protein n=1 Tax=Faecalispora anaeroviscerum TaxID=2991836 RepID=UPI0024BB92B1|nr:TMEM165/GDT1 family protein [Faecalispora anaeroviscerum]
MGITALVFSLGAVVLAEMGDKTQLLAMAFAAKYKASKVMMGVFLATILNHALAVVVGHMLTRFDTIQVWIQGIAALSFLFFGLWTIRGDKLEGEENRTTKFGAVLTVAIAFFIAEMGDKTQLTTVALAAKFPTNPLWILSGTTLGMLIADGVGIIVGVVLCKKIPERTVKLISAAVFIFFGFLGSYQVMRNDLGLSTDIIMLTMTVLYALTAAATIYLLKKEKGQETTESVPPACCPIKKEI